MWGLLVAGAAPLVPATLVNMTTKPIDDRLLRVAVLAADLWAMDNDSVQMTDADRTRGMVRTAVTHLIDQGLLTVPDDISERLDQPISIRWEHGETTTVTRYGRPSFLITPMETSMSQQATTTTYECNDDEVPQAPTERIVITRDGDEVSEVFTSGDDIISDGVAYAGDNADEYLRRRDQELTGDGYRQV